MKFISILAVVGSMLQATEWRSYESALIEQKNSHKPLMIDAMRTNCHYCSNMEKAVFEDKEMSAWLEKRFIPVKINIDNEKLPLGLNTSFTPTFFFVDEKHNVVKTIPGSWNIEDFKDLTRKIK
jgi:thioredoxin-related protein